MIFAGMRTSAVAVVATATITPLANVQSLGTPILEPQTYGDSGQLAAAIVVALITLAVDAASAWRASTPKGCRSVPRNPVSGAQPSHFQPQQERRHRQCPETSARSARSSPSSSSASRLVPAEVTTSPASSGSSSSSSSEPAVLRRRQGDREGLGQRRQEAHHRLEELRRAVHPRRDLRPGADRRRLQRQEAARPRLGADRLQGAQVEQDQRLPRVLGHGAVELLRRQDRRHPARPAGVLRPAQGRTRRRTASPPCRRRRSRTPTW